ncbi:hypothetical protein [uncultured Sphingomonas sp.]|uniref:hypothetical protein n=1 Tax=uncultured Sphingomonas sp. TaxID=158754 RepID=UPI0035CBD223
METALTYRVVQDRIHAAQADILRAKEDIAEATKRIDDLHGEIGDLLAAARVLARIDGIVNSAFDEASSTIGATDTDFDPNESGGNPYRPSTNKAFMWAVLADADRVWLTANEIQELAARLRGSEIPMSSVSPGLSEMKQDGTIERDGMKVALKIRLKENGATEAAPDAEGTAIPSIQQMTLPPWLKGVSQTKPSRHPTGGGLESPGE